MPSASATLARGRADTVAAPSISSSTEPTRRAIERRAIEAVNWGLPAVNLELIFQAMAAMGGKRNEIVYWSKLADWKNQTLTPNSDTIYFIPFYDTTNGPVVIEIPPADGGSITGTIMDYWQAALEDVGPAGVDNGSGGKYFITPPGYADPVPKDHVVLPSMTYRGYALLRSITKSRGDADVAAAVAYGKQIKIYSASNGARPAQTIFHDAFGTLFDSTIRYDSSFFEMLDRVVQAEPWLKRDEVMIDMLKTIGIRKGKPFEPDAGTKDILTEAATQAHAWLNARYEQSFDPYYEGGQWAVPAQEEMMKTASTFYEAENTYTVDGRGLLDFWAFTTVKHLGPGQFYLLAIRDKDGDFLDGSKTYRLKIPANVPMKQFWSATVYDRATHAFVRETPATARSSQTPGLQIGSDGTVELTFASKASRGSDANWIPTNVGGSFEVLFRFYSPQKPLFEKTWALPDIEKVK